MKNSKKNAREYATKPNCSIVTILIVPQQSSIESFFFFCHVGCFMKNSKKNAREYATKPNSSIVTILIVPQQSSIEPFFSFSAT